MNTVMNLNYWKVMLVTLLKLSFNGVRRVFAILGGSTIFVMSK